jgi:hypothetical protein
MKILLAAIHVLSGHYSPSLRTTHFLRGETIHCGLLGLRHPQRKQARNDGE